MYGVTTWAQARKNRGQRKRKDDANVSQVLNMTPEKGSRENLAAATTIQRARAAAEQYDRRASYAGAESMEEWQRKGAARESFSGEPSFASDPPVEWTPEEGYVSTDDEEDYGDEEKAADAVPGAAANDAEVSEADASGAAANAADASKVAADDDAVASDATAEDAATGSSIIETPLEERSKPTQSDLDFIVEDEDPDDPTYVQTESDNDEEEEEILDELLSSGKLNQRQSEHVQKRLRKLRRGRAIARTLFEANQPKVPEDGAGMTSISPPLTTPTAARPGKASGSGEGSGPAAADGDSLGAAAAGGREKGEQTMPHDVESKEQPEQPNSVKDDNVQHTDGAHKDQEPRKWSAEEARK